MNNRFQCYTGGNHYTHTHTHTNTHTHINVIIQDGSQMICPVLFKMKNLKDEAATTATTSFRGNTTDFMIRQFSPCIRYIFPLCNFIHYF